MTPQRIQRKRTKGWKSPANTIYVGRPTKWGNPFRVVQMSDGEWSVKTDGSEWCTEILIKFGHAVYPSKESAIKDAVAMYGYWLIPYEHGDNMSKFYISISNLEEAIQNLKGKNLSCFCPLDQPCHADILLKLANI